jgi:hypothetical protein
MGRLLQHRPCTPARIAILTAFLTAFMLPRLIGLGTYVTADEPQYLKLSAKYYLLLSEGRFSETDLIVHPGVPALSSGALAFRLLLPDYLDDPRVTDTIADLRFHQVLRDSGLSLIYMLAASRLVVIVLQAVVLALAFLAGQRVVGFWPALLAAVLVSFDPFYFANSRILQPDGLLAAAMLLSLLAVLAYLYDRRRMWLFVSAAAAALAMLSKVPGVVMVPVAAGLLLAGWRFPQLLPDGRPYPLKQALTDLALWVLAAAAVFVLLWPVMWSRPVAVLSDLAAFTASASGQVNSPFFYRGAILPEGEFLAEYEYYPLAFVWRTTPVVLAGLAAGITAAVLARKDAVLRRRYGLPFWLLVVLAVLLMAAFTLSVKRFDRYALPAYLLLDAAAALGLCWLLDAWLARRSGRVAAGAVVGLAALAVVVQAGLVAGAHPYYHAYYNPMLGGLEQAREVFMVGWGEGLDQVARYLNQHAEPGTDRVYASYSGAMQFHYAGVVGEVPFGQTIPAKMLDRLLEADYLVLYLPHRQRGAVLDLMAALEEAQPVYVVTIKGVEMAWVYDMRQVRMEAGQ